MSEENRLREIWNKRKVELRLTQEKAAELMGFEHQSTISQYLNGKAPLNMENTIKFANVLGVKPEEIRPDLSDLFQYVRNSGDPDFQPNQTGWMRLNAREQLLVELFKRIPEAEKDSIVSELQNTVDKYDKLFKELLKIQNQ